MVTGLSERIESFRERVERGQQSRRAKQRAKEREQRKKEQRKEADRRARDRRISENEPENLREEAEASVRQVKLLSAELGISREDTQDLLESASNVLESAQQEGSDAIEDLDVDGDGDTDILQSFESEATEVDAFDLGGGSSPAEPSGSRGQEPFDPASVTFDPTSLTEPGQTTGTDDSDDQSMPDPTDTTLEDDMLDL